jgi:hypothetical protein
MKRALLILVALAGAAYAGGAPLNIPFVARLADGGTPLTGNHDLLVELYSAGSGGTALWSEERNPVAIPADGLLYLDLGSVTPFTNPSMIFDGTTKYLQITIDGQISTSRIPVESAPYAINASSAATADSATTANDATNLGGKPPSAYQAAIMSTCTAGTFISAINPATGVATCTPENVYTAGTGLSLTGTAFSVDPTQVQSRVTGTCGPNAAIATVNQDGSVTCQPVSSYTAGNGLTLTGTTFSIDKTKTQERIAGSCTAGFAIRAVDNTGNVTCEPTSGLPASDSGSVATSETAAAGASYGDLTTTGPSATATVPSSGNVMVVLTAEISPSGGGNFGFMSFTGGGVTANDGQALMVKGGALAASASIVLTGETAGASITVTAKYKSTGGTAAFANRQITIVPLP